MVAYTLAPPEDDNLLDLIIGHQICLEAELDQLRADMIACGIVEAK